MHAGLHHQDGDAFDVSEPIPLHWPVPKDKQVRLALHFESEIPSEVFLSGVTGLNTVPLQFVYNVLRRIISEGVDRDKIGPDDRGVERFGAKRNDGAKRHS